MTPVSLDDYRAAMQQELQQILTYWMEHTIDQENGGFYGQIDSNNQVQPHAPKGGVLNSRILWAFSAAYNQTRNEQYLAMADRACDYLLTHFIDKEYGGLYWTVNYTGEPLDTKKQIYASAFAIYGLSEYWKATRREGAREAAIDLYRAIEQYSFDPVATGYIDAFARNWQPMEDIRLSDKDANEKKTMNTHLHVLEAYTNLYAIWGEEELRHKIELLIGNFTKYIINEQTHHLTLFFNEHWDAKGEIISYGHDIEVAWLVQEAAEAIEDEVLIAETRKLAIKIADAAREGLHSDGGLWYEYEPSAGYLVKEKHSWPQAEAMVGFMNAYQVSLDESYLQLSYRSWQFAKQHIKDHQWGEWHWGVLENYEPMPGMDKAGLWKCPYHNSRACMEVIKRIDWVQDTIL